MPYDKPLVQSTFACAPWYKVSVLLDTINSVRKINYSIQEERSRALLILNTMPTANVFSDEGRFSATGSFVCEFEGDWTRKFQLLKTSLSFKDYSNKSRPESKIGETPVQLSSDSSQAFWNMTTNIVTSIMMKENVFTRESFENHFDLKWTDDEPLDLENAHQRQLRRLREHQPGAAEGREGAPQPGQVHEL
jgi:hypothetical protein